MSLKPLLASTLLWLPAAIGAADPGVPAGGQLMVLDLSKPFGLASGWRLTATQAPPVDDHGDKLPGRITLCIQRATGACDPALESGPIDDPEPSFAGFHVLDEARLVHPHGRNAPPFLLVRGSSLWGFNGDRDVITQLITYDRGRHAFRRAYRFQTRLNNNQEVRYFDAGRLKGMVISAEPTSNLPYGYWITVNAPGGAYSYRQLLRYRSATIYGDGNPLGVIDSEMPNIQRRLGLWHAGMPLPLPPHCAKPHLIRAELWCN